MTSFYYKNYQQLSCCGANTNVFSSIFAIIPPLRLNHPPEEAFQFIRDQQQSTYLEEYTYPFRDALFVNGFEPVDKSGRRFNKIYKPILLDGVFYSSKTTLRYYNTSIVWRVVVYIFIWVLGILLFKLIFKSIKEKV